MRLPPFCIAALLSVIPAHAGIYAHYSFDSGYEDSSPNRRHGTLVDAETAGNSGITNSTGSFKFGGGALNLSADRDFVTIPLQTFASPRHYSIAFWAKKQAGDTGDLAMWDMVIGERNTTGFFIGLGDSGGPTGLRWRSSNDTTARQADFAVPRDYDWHHYVVVASGTTITLYLDGQFFGNATGKLTGFTFDTIGDGYPSRRFGLHGQLDEMWIFDEALGAAAVSNLYQSNDAGIPASTATRLRVFLLGGQSNADGRADASGLPAALQLPQPNVDLFYKVEGSNSTLTTLRPGLSETNQFGPEIMLGTRLAKIYADEPNTRVAIIKYANGGTNLHTQWKAGGDATTTGDGPEYVIFQQTVKEGLLALAAAHPQAQIEIEGLAWMQGESDATATYSGLYQENLTRFIADVRATLGKPVPFLIGQLSNGQTDIQPAQLATMRAAQEAVAAADPLTAIVKTDGFTMKSDNLHFEAAGYQAMGSGFAGEAAYYAWVTSKFSPEDIAAGLAEPEADRDGDGKSNHSEFISGSDPLAGDSQLRAWFSVAGPVAGVISYPTTLSRAYSVEKYSETEGTWKPELPASQGTGEVVGRNLETPDARGIYRVRVELP